MTRRIAMLSVHACPLAKLGGRDSGGMNVYVRELARDLGARGIEGDVPAVERYDTLERVKREVMDEDIDGESDIRVEIEREAVQKAAAVIAASKIELDELRRLYRADASRVAVIPCGVDPALFHPVRQADAREKLGRDQCERIILFVGRIEQIKGIDVLLRALGLLFQRHPEMQSDVCLLVVGGALDPGDDAPETEKILELRRLVHEHRLESNVSFVGSRGQEDLALYYAAADLCAVPSLTESFGLVALEA